jgi:mono/diheme cytochrome c family protein
MTAGTGGAALQQRCARCHDADGAGKSSRGNLKQIPDFTSHKWQSSRSDAELLVSILDGKGSHMPAYRGKVSDAEARKLVADVRALDPTPAVKAAADDASDDFERRFRRLQEELADLKKQFREVESQRRKRE